MKKILTIKEFAEITGMEYAMASQVIALMVDVEQAKATGKKSIEGQRGKPSVTYEIPAVVSFQFWDEVTGEENKSDIPAADPVETVTPESLAKDLIPA